MKLRRQLEYWERKRGTTLSKKQAQFLNYQTTAYFETLIDRRQLLTDIPVKQLRKGFVFKVFDKLYAYASISTGKTN